jgi:hypothetical protein
MTATRPVWRPGPVALDVLTALREAQSRDLLGQLVEPRDPRTSRRHRVTGRSVAAGLGAGVCVLAVIVLYVLVIGRLGVPVDPGSFGG